MSENEFEFEGKTYRVHYGLEVKKEDGFNYLNYEGIIKELHPEFTWIYEQDDDYQGDFYAVGYNSKGYNFIQGSFGSCSGCDWLQAIGTETEAKELLTHYKKEIIHKDTLLEMISYLYETLDNISFKDKTTLEKIITSLKSMK